MVNTPIPHSLKSEARKAAKILRDFTIPSAKTGPDKIIPGGILVNAEGLAILTVVKLGFLVTARGGSGIVIAKLNDGSWSAPSAIGIAGLGGGFEIGAEVTDFVIILTKRSAVDAFSKGGNLTLGGNFTIAAGPLGRNVEGDVSVRSPAAIYTYSKTKGLFAGISIEGSYLIERKDANKKFYAEDLRANEILTGLVDPPAACEELYKILAEHQERYNRQLVAVAKRAAVRGATEVGERSGFMTRTKSVRQRDSQLSASPTSKKKSSSATDVSRSASDRYSSSYKGSWADGGDDSDSSEDEKADYSSSHMTRSQSTKSGLVKMTTTQKTTTVTVKSSSRQSGGRPTPAGANWDATPICKALWPYQGQMPCDLSFTAGDVIEIRTRTDTQNDWWEGVVHGRTGIFPANYVQVM